MSSPPLLSETRVKSAVAWGPVRFRLATVAPPLSTLSTPLVKETLVAAVCSRSILSPTMKPRMVGANDAAALSSRVAAVLVNARPWPASTAPPNSRTPEPPI